MLNGETTAFVPAVASDGDRGIYVGWPDEREHSLQIFLNRSLDGGDSWLPAEVRIDGEDRAMAKDVVLTTDGGAGVLAVWEERTSHRAITAAVSKDRGSTWSVPVQIDDGGGRGSPTGPHDHRVWVWRQTVEGP